MGASRRHECVDGYVGQSFSIFITQETQLMTVVTLLVAVAVRKSYGGAH